MPDPKDEPSEPAEGSASTEGGAGEGAKDSSGAAPAAAENRRARRAARATSRKQTTRERERLAEIGLDAGERVDDAFARVTDRAYRFIKRHFNVVQWLIVAGIATWVGWQIYTWRSDKTAAKTSEVLAEAVNADLGRVGGQEDDPEARTSDTRRSFASDEERLKITKAAYEKVVSERPSASAVDIAKLGLAGLLYDEGKYDEAKKLYDEAAASELAKLDPEAKGRSVEGAGLSLEGKGDKDGALKRFNELENIEVAGYRELALFHQARILHSKNDDEGAKERLKKVIDKLGKEKESTALDSHGYVYESARAMLERIDPKALPPPSSDEALRKALEQFQKKAPGVTPIPMPAGP